MSRSNLMGICPHCGKPLNMVLSVNLTRALFDIGIVSYDENVQNDDTMR